MPTAYTVFSHGKAVTVAQLSGREVCRIYLQHGNIVALLHAYDIRPIAVSVMEDDRQILASGVGISLTW
ncbi:MAG: hypothetical protein V8T45_08375 [Oscillospiraceae bacterium]